MAGIQGKVPSARQPLRVPVLDRNKARAQFMPCRPAGGAAGPRIRLNYFIQRLNLHPAP
jgi:hypothetical protein